MSFLPISGTVRRGVSIGVPDWRCECCGLIILRPSRAGLQADIAEHMSEPCESVCNIMGRIVVLRRREAGEDGAGTPQHDPDAERLFK